MTEKSGRWPVHDNDIETAGSEPVSAPRGRGGSTPPTLRAYNLGGLLNLFKRRWILIVSVGFVIAMGIASLGFLFMPRYTAEAFIRIDPSNKSVFDVSAAYGRPPDAAFVDTEVNEIVSRPVAESVVQRLNLAHSAEFRSRASITNRIIGVVVTPTDAEDFDSAVDSVLRRLRVAREGTSYRVSVRFTSTSSERAALVANTFVDEYLNHSRNLQSQNAEGQAKTLNAQLEQLAESVRAADAALAKYRAAMGLVRDSGSGTVNDQQIASISAQLGSAEATAAAAMSRANGAKLQTAEKGTESVAEVLASPVVTELRKQRAELVRDQARVLDTYGPLHPNSVHMLQQLSDLDAQIQQEAQRIISGLENAAQTTAAAAKNLREQLQILRAEQANNLRSSVQADSLERDAQAKRATYERVAQAVQQIGQDVIAPAGRLSSLATEPRTPSFPSKALFAVLGLLLGAIAALAAAFTADALDKSIRLASYFPDSLGIPFFGSVPRLTSRALRNAEANVAWDFVKARPRSAYAESLRSIRTALVMSRPDLTNQVICITSALPKEGKSTLAVSLARLMAMSGDKVILIDGDTRRKPLRALARSAPTVGLLEVLQDTSQLPRALLTDIERLHVLPQSEQVDGFENRDMLGGKRMRTLLRVLRSAYRFVIIDAPPLLAVADACSLAAAADRTLLVARWGKTPRSAIQSAHERLQQSQALSTGGVFTQINIEASAELGEANPYFYYADVRDYYGV